MIEPSKIFDGLLVLKYRSGTVKALNILVKKYHDRLCSHSYWYTNDIDAAKDIVQDSWGIIVNKLDTLKDPNQFGSWAFRIVTRRSLDYVAKRKRELEKLKVYQKENVFEDVAEISQTSDKEKLLSEIKKLSKEQQIVLRLFYIEDYSLKEISEIIEVSVGTVKSRLFHAREKLKTNFKI